MQVISFLFRDFSQLPTYNILVFLQRIPPIQIFATPQKNFLIHHLLQRVHSSFLTCLFCNHHHHHDRYVVCRDSCGEKATVVLSEFAGCARSLGGALLVNPWNTVEVKGRRHRMH